jgi:hypothetical protein
MLQRGLSRSNPPMGKYDPPEMDLATLIVDTTDDYNPTLDQIISFAIAGDGKTFLS